MSTEALVKVAKRCTHPNVLPQIRGTHRQWTGGRMRGSDDAGDDQRQLADTAPSEIGITGTNTLRFHLYWVPGGGDNGEFLLNGDGVLVWEDEKVLEIEVLVMQHCTVKLGSFTLSYFTTIEKCPRTQN